MFKKSTAALIALILIWGASWPINKLAVPYSPPLLYAGQRALLGGILLTVIIWKTRKRVNWRENWKKYCIGAFFNTILFFGLQTAGLLYLPSGLFSVLVYFQPILLGLFAWLLLGESLSPVKILGLFLGFVGVAVVSVDGLTVHVSAIGVTLGLLTAVSWAFGVIYVKKISKEVDAYWMVALQCIIGGVFLLGTGSVFESWSAIEWNRNYLSGLSFGATIGIPLAYILYYNLVNAGEASKVGSYTFLIPIVAVLLGVLFLGETVTYSLVIGMLLVAISIYFVNFQHKTKNKSISKD
ncbi:drug/metabolite transporter (DMT)-like permease [Solibacillus kalamii]|uniref:EamA family transporter n=1 Tax=Solibacillus kalamii TaxID=1748298 RepID=A0ABX3ZGP0_9BACL|nr:drug/metabolite transporter (DMT)-like permease [Solibacillus kalamii]OUZ38570.1 EamA family transporter [Solibacillus kalamii]